jgi:hypothetical protein
MDYDIEGHQEMTLDEIAESQRFNYMLPEPEGLTLLGSPGTAKTAFVKNTLREVCAEARGLALEAVHVIVTQPSIYDSIEYAGVGVPQKREDGQLATRFSVPALIEQIEAARAAGAEFIILLFDEIAAAGDDMQKLLAGAFNPEENRIAGFGLGENIQAVGTGNTIADKAGSRKLLTHVVNRQGIVVVKKDHSVWFRWAEANDVMTLIIECAKVNPDFFADAVPKGEAQYCTYRSATAVSKWLSVWVEAQDNWDGRLSEMARKAVATRIGKAAANTLANYAENIAKEVPSPAEIFADPDNAPLPNGSDAKGFQWMAVNRAISDLSKGGAEAGNALFTYVQRCKPDMVAILAAKVCKAAVRCGLDIDADGADDFMRENADLMKLLNG